MPEDFAAIRKRQIEIYGQASPLVQSGIDAVPARLAAAYRTAQGLEPVPFDALPDVMQSVWRRVAQTVVPQTQSSNAAKAFSFFNTKCAQTFGRWLKNNGGAKLAEDLYKEFPEVGQ